jgi:hypothetical protein
MPKLKVENCPIKKRANAPRIPISINKKEGTNPWTKNIEAMLAIPIIIGIGIPKNSNSK